MGRYAEALENLVAGARDLLAAYRELARYERASTADPEDVALVREAVEIAEMLGDLVERDELTAWRSIPTAVGEYHVWTGLDDAGQFSGSSLYAALKAAMEAAR